MLAALQFRLLYFKSRTAVLKDILLLCKHVGQRSKKMY